MPKQDEISISKERYQELIEAERWLGCLQAAGVDNWDGVDEARGVYQLNTEEDE